VATTVAVSGTRPGEATVGHEDVAGVTARTVEGRGSDPDPTRIRPWAPETQTVSGVLDAGGMPGGTPGMEPGDRRCVPPELWLGCWCWCWCVGSGIKVASPLFCLLSSLELGFQSHVPIEPRHMSFGVEVKVGIEPSLSRSPEQGFGRGHPGVLGV
jgi:hypothetical protein